MKNIYLVSLASILCCLVACRKDAAAPGGNNNPPDTIPQRSGGDLLIKEVSIQNTVDSTVTVYAYNSDDRLETISTVVYSNSGATPATIYQGRHFYRDENARIKIVAEKNAADDPAGPDSLYTYVYYTSANSATVSYTIFSKPGVSATYDSAVYSYSGNTVTQVQHYYSDNWPAIAPVKGNYTLYDADANDNIIKVEDWSSALGAGVDSLQLGMYYTVDAKKNSYAKGEYPDPAGFLTGKNNIASMHVRLLRSGAYEESDYFSTYVYNTGDKPISRTTTPGSDASKAVKTLFFYNP